MMVIDGVEMYDVREAAARSDRTAETVRRWIWSGRLQARRQGQRLYVARADVERLSRRAGAREAATGSPGTRVVDESLAVWRRRVEALRASGRLGPTRPGASAADLVIEDRWTRGDR